MLQTRNIVSFHRKNLLVIVAAVARWQPPFYQKAFPYIIFLTLPSKAGGSHFAKACKKKNPESLAAQGFPGFVQLFPLCFGLR